MSNNDDKKDDNNEKVNRNIIKDQEYFKKLGYNLIEGPNWFIVIPKEEENKKIDEKSYCHTDEEKTCLLCKTKFKYGNKAKNICDGCKLIVKCRNEKCEKVYFEVKYHINLILDKIINKEPIYRFCSNSCTNIGTNGYDRIKMSKKECNVCKKITIHRGNTCLICNPEAYGAANPERLKEFNKSDLMRRVSSETRKRDWQNPEYAAKISKNLGEYLGNPDWAREVGAKGREILAAIFKQDPTFGSKIIKKAQEKLAELWENDPEWAEKQRKNLSKARKNQIELFKKHIDKINVIFNNIKINYSKIKILKNNDICGSYVIKAKFKNDVNTKKEGNIYNILVCKSVKVYDEIYWALRVISQPEKQDKVVTDDNPWTIAKWWYIANLYYDFEFELITDEDGISEDIAILAEAKYGFGNDMLCDREQIERDGYSKNHSYWSL